MTQKILSILPIVIFLGLLSFVGYLFVGGDLLIGGVTATPTATATPAEPIPTDTPSPTLTPTPVPVIEPTDRPTSIPPTDTPTPTPSPPPTETSSPTNTATATATPTATATGTNTPVPPTITPTSTDTPTPIPTSTATPTIAPTFTPTAVPAEARVAATTGLTLWTGPGVDGYEEVTTLPGGTPLDVLRPVVNKANWVKVSAKLAAGEVVTGYVTTASDAVTINVDLEEIPPIYEHGPHLLEPKRFETRSVEEGIEFSWQPVAYPLEEYQSYSLILVRDDLSDEEACFHWQTKETKLSFKPEDYDCTAGAYNWRVGVATDLSKGKGEDRIWRDDSEKDEQNPIGLGIPHPDKPSGGGSDGGNGISTDPNGPID